MQGIVRNPRVALRRTVVAGALALAVLAACDDPSGPGYSLPTIENIWPNEDGRFWDYELVVRTWDEPGVPLYAAPEDVPPITLDDIESFLDYDHPGSNIVSEGGAYALEFAGLTPIPGGRLVQNLSEQLYGPLAGKPAPAGTFEDALLARLERARPDLRAKIAARRGGREVPAAPQVLEAPIMLHGGAWEKTFDEIGTYGDLDDQLAWLYLDSDLLPGSEFEFQLVPSLADDVFLLCRILQRTSVDTQVGRLRYALECLYVVDYGVAAVVTDNQVVLGSFRLFDYGIVTYAPDVGPVRCLERRFNPPSIVVDTWGRRAGDIWLDVTSTGLPVAASAEAR